jgi:ketosteroid isomerase-like protein
MMEAIAALIGSLMIVAVLGGCGGTNMTERRTLLIGLGLGLGAAAAASHGAEPLEALAASVRARETAFAKSMADRDHAAFGRFVAEEAVFMGRTALRGRAAVVEGWKPYFEGPQAPFSWTPERVEVIASGTLAISSGPVFDPQGNRVGTFNSTWRREADGEWRVVIDIGCPPCR